LRRRRPETGGDDSGRAGTKDDIPVKCYLGTALAVCRENAKFFRQISGTFLFCTSMSTLTITTIQANLQWENKAANLQYFSEKINGIRENTEIVVLPEMFSTGFSMKPETLAERMDGPSMDWMKKTAAQKRVILTGSLIIEEEGNYFNRLIWMLPNGQYGYYDKRHRFAYAGENEHYTAGKKRLIASVKGWRINLLVCYDLRFPVWSRQAANSPLENSELEYDLLIYVANWPERRSHAWKTLLQARAIETQSYVVGVNRVGEDGNNISHSGDSMIIDPQGEVLYHGLKEEAIFTYTLRKERLEEVRSRFPFWRDADDFSIEP
jgi:omega-amidase